MSQESIYGKTERPMRLFLSYGHPENEICKAIVAALKSRGHDVWMDETHLPHGVNWRREIETGLEKSQGVVACLSRHSVRDPGVCLDELSIAVGVKGGNVFTVLLEPERNVDAPASVCHLQWLDMSDWAARQGKPGWDDWFIAKMKQLMAELESPESVQFAGQIEELRKKLSVDYSTSKQRSLLKQLFVGRAWLTDEIEAWLADKNGAKLCVLYGDPGIGKSAFAAHYGHYNPAVAASLFLEFDHPHYGSVRSVTCALAYLLACRIPDYRQALVTALEGAEIGGLSDAERFDRLIVRPAGYCIDGNRETMCIVIDGLDESSGAEQNALAEVLSQYVPRLPRWLRVLATSREVAAVQGPLEGTYHLTLHGGEAQNLADVRAYFTETLAEQFGGDPAWPRALDALTARSDGIFLYAQLVADAISKGKMGIDDTDAFPAGLSSAFHRWFTCFFPDAGEFKRLYRLPLAMILAAGQLPEEELRRVLHWRESEKDDFLQRISVLLTREADDFRRPAVRFSHQYLRDWLKAAPMTDLYRVSETDAVDAMAKAFYAVFRNDPEELTAFEALHLAPYLQRSGMKKQAREAEMSDDLLRRIVDAGDTCDTWGKLDSALACYRQARAMAEAMCREGNAPEARRSLGASYNRVAHIRQALGDLPGALDLYEKSRALFEQLAREQDAPQNRRDLSVSYSSMADIKQLRGDLTGALALYEKSLTLLEQLARELDTPEARRDLGVSYGHVADVKKAQADLLDEQKLHEKSKAIFEQFAEEQSTPEDRRDLSVCNEKAEDIQEAQGDPPNALEAFERFRTHFIQFAREQNTPQDRRGLSVCNEKAEGIQEAQGELLDALELYEKSITLFEQLVRERNTPGDRRALSASYCKVAGIREARGDLPGALELYEKSLAIDEQLVRERNTPGARRDLSVSYNKVAGIMKTRGDLTGALALYEKSLALSQQLVQERGAFQDYNGLAEAYRNILEIPGAHREKRLEYAEEGLRIVDMLREKQPCSYYTRLSFFFLLHTLRDKS